MHRRCYYDTNRQAQWLLIIQGLWLLGLPAICLINHASLCAQSMAIGAGIAFLPNLLLYAVIKSHNNHNAPHFLAHLYLGVAIKMILCGIGFWASFVYLHANNLCIITAFILSQSTHFIVQFLRCFPFPRIGSYYAQ